jgi:hypothetical protein
MSPCTRSAEIGPVTAGIFRGVARTAGKGDPAESRAQKGGLDGHPPRVAPDTHGIRFRSHPRPRTALPVLWRVTCNNTRQLAVFVVQEGTR